MPQHPTTPGPERSPDGSARPSRPPGPLGRYGRGGSGSGDPSPGAGAVARVGAGLWWVGRWALLGAASGLLAGLACFAFLEALDHATETRGHHPGLIWLLPFGGLAVGWVYHRFGGRASGGNALLLDEVHEPTAWVPRRMAPMVAVGSVVSHLFGASVGREGTAVQMSGSLTDGLARLLGLRAEDRRILLTAALGGGFGAVFGVPVAGVLFGLEVQRTAWTHRPVSVDAATAGDPGSDVGPGSVDGVGEAVGRVPIEVPAGDDRGPDRGPDTDAEPDAGGGAETVGDDGPPIAALRARTGGPVAIARRFGRLLVPTAAASFVGNLVVRGLGHDHPVRPHPQPLVDAALLVRVAALGVAFGIAAVVFIEAVDLVHRAAGRWVRWPPARPFAGGVLILVGVALVGRSYLGLSLPLAGHALSGAPTSLDDPLLKLAFTAICIGTGFVGGEVTPLFVIGATLGAALSPSLGVAPVLGAAVGFVAVFGGAANVPLTCTVAAVELFGRGLLVPAAVGCFAAYLCSGSRGIYPSQRIASAAGTLRAGDAPRLRDWMLPRPRRR